MHPDRQLANAGRLDPLFQRLVKPPHHQRELQQQVLPSAHESLVACCDEYQTVEIQVEPGDVIEAADRLQSMKVLFDRVETGLRPTFGGKTTRGRSPWSEQRQ